MTTTTATKELFTRDSRSEKFLQSVGVGYRYSKTMTFEQLEPKWDAYNLGRSQVVVEKAVETFGTLMDKGSLAPAPIIWLNPETKKYEVLDGIQRLLAAELRQPSVWPGYVVTTDSFVTAKKLRVFANYRLQGGYQESSDWTLESAVVLLLNSNLMSVEEISEVGGWSPSVIRDKKQVVDFGSAIRGVGGPDKLSDALIRVMAKHSKPQDFEEAPVALAGFTNDIQTMRLSAEAAEPYIEQFFSTTRSRGNLFQQFEKKLQDFRNSDDVATRLADPSRRRYQAMTPDGRLHKALTSALTTVTGIRDNGDFIEDTTEYYQLVNRIQSTLQQIAKINKKGRKRNG